MMFIACFYLWNDEKLCFTCKVNSFLVIEVVCEMMCDIIPTQTLVVPVWSLKG
jgi:hypothetical protein